MVAPVSGVLQWVSNVLSVSPGQTRMFWLVAKMVPISIAGALFIV